MGRANRKDPITDRNHVLNFSKFKGQSVAMVMKEEPSFLVWLHNNVPQFELGSDLLEEAEGHRDDDYEIGFSMADIYGKP